MRVLRRSEGRMDIIHRPGVLLVLAGLVGAGYAVYLFLAAEGWGNYVGAGVCLLASVASALMATNSYVILDWTTRLMVARHRYLFFGVKYSLIPLDEITAVAINTDSIGGSVLAVICVRVNDTDLPLTMFGSPFPAAVHRHAVRIARFLGVPLLDKDRLVLKGPEDQVQDLYGDVVSRAVFDPPSRDPRRGRR